MKKINAKKLQLKKGVVAHLGKIQMDKAAGGQDPSLFTCPCITEYPTHPCKSEIANQCILAEMPTERICG